MSSVQELRGKATEKAILKAKLEEHDFELILKVDKQLSVADECLFYCMKCIEHSLAMSNLDEDDVCFAFKTSRILPTYYEDIARKVCSVCEALRLTNPRLFDHLQVKLRLGLLTRHSVCSALRDVREAIFENGVSWEKIIALFAITGSLIAECVVQGNSEFVISILYSTKQFAESELVDWIKKREGWVSMLRQFQSLYISRPGKPEGRLKQLKSYLHQSISRRTSLLASSIQEALESSKHFVIAGIDCCEKVSSSKTDYISMSYHKEIET